MACNRLPLLSLRFHKYQLGRALAHTVMYRVRNKIPQGTPELLWRHCLLALHSSGPLGILCIHPSVTHFSSIRLGIEALPLFLWDNKSRACKLRRCHIQVLQHYRLGGQESQDRRLRNLDLTRIRCSHLRRWLRNRAGRYPSHQQDHHFLDIQLLL